jgi:excisionase family DNA binding protein
MTPSPVPESPTVLYTVPEAAAILHIGASTLWLFLSRGDIGSIKIGRRRLIRQADLDAYVASLAGGAQ